MPELTPEEIAESPPTTVESLEAKREAELKERQQIAQGRAQALAGLMLGEQIQADENMLITAVPNGWIYTITHKAGVSSTFVPGMPVPQKKESGIVLPS